MPVCEVVFPASRTALDLSHGYFAAVRAGHVLCVSGEVRSFENSRPAAEFRNQVQLTSRNLEYFLAAAKARFDHSICFTSFHAELEKQFEANIAAKYLSFAKVPDPAFEAVGNNSHVGLDAELDNNAHKSG